MFIFILLKFKYITHLHQNFPPLTTKSSVNKLSMAHFYMHIDINICWFWQNTDTIISQWYLQFWWILQWHQVFLVKFWNSFSTLCFPFEVQLIFHSEHCQLLHPLSKIVPIVSFFWIPNTSQSISNKKQNIKLYHIIPCTCPSGRVQLYLFNSLSCAFCHFLHQIWIYKVFWEFWSFSFFQRFETFPLNLWYWQSHTPDQNERFLFHLFFGPHLENRTLVETLKFYVVDGFLSLVDGFLPLVDGFLPTRRSTKFHIHIFQDFLLIQSNDILERV